MKKLFPNFILCISTVIAFFIILEIALALLWPHKLKHRPYHEKYDPVIGWVNKPLKDDDVPFEFAPNLYFHVRHNSKGLRGKETDYPKPAGIKRILFVGDSFFWGYGLNNKDVLTEVLQKKAGESVEIINGAATGYGTDQELLWLKNEGLKYKPDIVILGFFPTNDLDEISSSISYYFPKPVFVPDGDKLVLKNVPVPRTEGTERKAFANPPTFLGKLKKFLRYHTHTYPFIVGRLNSNPELRLLLINLGLGEEFTNQFPGIPLIKNNPADIEKLAFRLILEIKKTAEKAGAEFLLVHIPSKEQPAGANLYKGIREKAYENNATMSHKLQDFAAKEKIQLLDLLPVIRKRHKKGAIIYSPAKYDHHWTASGHQIAAETIYDYLSVHGLLSVSPASQFK